MARSVFVGHATEDVAAARRLYDALEARGLDCWLAARDADPGKDETFETVDALDASELVVFLITRHSARSDLLRNEDERAASQGKPSVCIQLDDADVPDGFASVEDATDIASDALETDADEIAEFVRSYVPDGTEGDGRDIETGSGDVWPGASTAQAGTDANSRAKALVAIGTILALVVGLAGAGAAVLVPDSHQHPRSIDGHFTVYDTTGTAIVARDGGCTGAGGYEDIHEGTFVSVTNDAGATIATAQLGAGIGTVQECRFPFLLETLPEAPPYGVEVSDRGVLRYTESELDDLGWDVGITLGKS